MDQKNPGPRMHFNISSSVVFIIKLLPVFGHNSNRNGPNKILFRCLFSQPGFGSLKKSFFILFHSNEFSGQNFVPLFLIVFLVRSKFTDHRGFSSGIPSVLLFCCCSIKLPFDSFPFHICHLFCVKNNNKNKNNFVLFFEKISFQCMCVCQCRCSCLLGAQICNLISLP